MNEPRFGYGRDQRPLWSRRDRDAEVIRQVLRRAGFRDFDERHLNGFVVEGADTSENGPEPFPLTYCGDDGDPYEARRYLTALERAGLRAEPSIDNPRVLLVQRRALWSAANAPLLARVLPVAALICAALATLALLASWAGSGPVALVAVVLSGLLGATAAFLGGLWYHFKSDNPADADARRV